MGYPGWIRVGGIEMRYVRLTAMAALVSVALLGALGASSASADTEVVVCSLNFLLCPSETEIYNKGQQYLATATAPKFVTSMWTAECPTAHLRVEMLAAMSEHLPYDAEFKFGKLGGKDCKGCSEVHATALFKGTVLVENPKGEGDVYTATLEKFDIELLGCSEALTCAYGGSLIKGVITNNESGAPKITFTKVPLKRTGGSLFCPSAAEWSTTYTIETPTPSYFALYQL
jgi:hypothetical protein